MTPNEYKEVLESGNRENIREALYYAKDLFDHLYYVDYSPEREEFMKITIDFAAKAVQETDKDVGNLALDVIIEGTGKKYNDISYDVFADNIDQTNEYFLPLQIALLNYTYDPKYTYIFEKYKNHHDPLVRRYCHEALDEFAEIERRKRLDRNNFGQ